MLLMRKPERLDDTYSKLCEIQKMSFPDMREAQYMLNLLGWINSNKRDPFFIESDELIEYAKEYANANSMMYRGWEILEKNKT